MNVIYDKKEDSYHLVPEDKVKCINNCKECDTHILRDTEVLYFKEIQKINSLKTK